MIGWAEGIGGDIYWDGTALPNGAAVPNGNVDESNPDNSGQLEDEVLVNNEAAYREFLCGKGRISLTAYQWRLISMPCDTKTNSVEDVLAGLGVYGDNYVMYKQTGTDNYEVNETEGSSYKNTNKAILTRDALLEQGISYWIITDADRNVTIPKTGLPVDLEPTPTTDNVAIVISDTEFDKVNLKTLPDNVFNNTGYIKKLMAGNPFPFAFDVTNLYFGHGGLYEEMGNIANDTYINSTIYTHDSSDLTDGVGGSAYKAIVPGTPGLGGSVQPMEGFFIKILEEGSADSNTFAYPLTYGNDK